MPSGDRATSHDSRTGLRRFQAKSPSSLTDMGDHSHCLRAFWQGNITGFLSKVTDYDDDGAALGTEYGLELTSPQGCCLNVRQSDLHDLVRVLKDVAEFVTERRDEYPESVRR